MLAGNGQGERDTVVDGRVGRVQQRQAKVELEDAGVLELQGRRGRRVGAVEVGGGAALAAWFGLVALPPSAGEYDNGLVKQGSGHLDAAQLAVGAAEAGLAVGFALARLGHGLRFWRG